MITAGLVWRRAADVYQRRARPAVEVNTASAGVLSRDPVSLYWQVSGYR
jgi:hypothetical protein